MRRLLSTVLVAAALAGAAPALAVNPDEVLPDPTMEARARALSSELRCLVCQNQSIDDSDAPLARDLRIIVREKLKAGATDGEIKGFLVDRYGEFVLLKPTFTARNALLWIGPFLVLLGGAAVVWVNGRRRRAAVQALSADEQARLGDLLSAVSGATPGSTPTERRT